MNTEALHALNDLTEAQKAFAAVSKRGDVFDIKFKRTGRIYIYITRDKRGTTSFCTTIDHFGNAALRSLMIEIEYKKYLEP